jgi:hypothetical protein
MGRGAVRGDHACAGVGRDRRDPDRYHHARGLEPVHGVAQLIVEGKLGKVGAARAKQLAIAATAVLGAGLAPRGEAYEDPLTGMTLTPRQRG